MVIVFVLLCISVTRSLVINSIPLSEYQLEGAKNYFPFMGADIKGTFSLPKFDDNFDDELGITDEVLKNQLLALVELINQE